MLYNWMPSWAKSKPKPKLYGLIGSLLGGIAGGVGWHIMAIDPPKIIIYAVEAGLVVALVILRKSKTPHSPNFNLIPTLTRCPLPT